MTIDQKLDLILNKLEEHDKRFDAYDKRFDSIELKLTILEANNREEHEKISKILDSLNTSFIKFEVECSDKFRILFDAHEDYLEHKDIFAHELYNLNKIAKQNSYRISNLEKKFSSM